MSLEIKTLSELKQRKGGYNGVKVTLLGTTVIGDGGGRTYVWNAVSTATNNDTTIVQVTGNVTGRWLELATTSSNAAGINDATSSGTSVYSSTKVLELLTLKPDFLSTQTMSGSYFKNIGSVASPIIEIDPTQTGFIAAVKAALATLPGYDVTNVNLVLNTGFNWVPGGSGAPQLLTPNMTFSTSSTSQNVINWLTITNATGYVLQRADNSTYTTGLITIYTGALLTYTDTGLTSTTLYHYRLKATAVGYTDSVYDTDSKSTAAPADITAPTIISATVADNLRTRIVLTASESLLGNTVGVNDFTVYNGKTISGLTISDNSIVINVDSAYVLGDVITVSYTSSAGKIADSAGNLLATLTNLPVTNNVGGDVTAPSFTGANVYNTLRSRVVVTFNENLVLGNTAASNIVVSGKTVSSVSISGASLLIDVTVPFVNANVITFTYTSAAGSLQDASGNLVATLTNQTVTNNVNADPAAPTIIADDATNTLDATHVLGDTEIMVSVNDTAYVQFDGSVINVGDIARITGYYKFKIKSAAGRSESPIAQSPAFTITGSSEVGTNLTSWPLLDAGTGYSQLTGNNINSVQTGGYTRLTSDFKIVSGGTGWVMCDAITSNSVGHIALHNGFNMGQTPSTFTIKLFRNGVNNTLFCDALNINQGSVSFPPAAGNRLRIKADGTNLLGQYSTNSGSSWTTLGTVAQPVGDLYAKTFQDVFLNDINNVQYFNMTNTQIVPSVPTNLTVNDTTKVITWDNASGLFNSDTEIRYKEPGGVFTKWAVHGSVTFDAAGKEITIGSFQIRTKALEEGRTCSATISNTVAITPLTFVINDNSWVFTPSTGATVSNGTITSSALSVFGATNYYIPSGGSGYVQIDLSTARSGIIGFDQGTLQIGSNDFDLGMAFAFDSKLQVRVDNTYLGTGEVLANASTTKARVRCNGTTMFVEYSTNSGSTWTQAHSTAQPAAILYLKVFLDNQVGSIMHNITGSNLLGNINPDAATAFIADNTLQTIGWTNSSGITAASDYEYTSNNEASWIQCIANPQPIGDGNKAIGNVKLRVRAIAGRNKSNSISNATAYTVKTYSPLSLTSWPSLLQTTATGNTLDTLAGGVGYGRAMSNYKLAIGASGFIRFTLNQSTIGSGTLGFITDGVDMNFGGNSYAIGLVMVENSKIIARKANNYYSDEVLQTKSVNLYGRVRGDGTYLYAEYSPDAGANWILLHVTLQGNVDLYVKSWMDVLPAQTFNIVQHNLTL